MENYHMKAKQSLWSERFAFQRARYVVFGIMGCLVVISLMVHDGGIWASVQNGADISTLNQLFFNISAEQVVLIMRIAFGLMMALIGYAIFIRIAQWHYNQRSIS